MMMNLKMPITFGSVVLAVGIYLLTRWLAKKIPPPLQPHLLDDLFRGNNSSAEVNGRWVVGRPLNEKTE